MAVLGLSVQLLQLLQLFLGGMKRHWGEAEPLYAEKPSSTGAASVLGSWWTHVTFNCAISPKAGLVHMKGFEELV